MTAAGSARPFRIRFHPKVQDDLKSILRLIADYAGQAAAERRLTEIEGVIRTLSQTPHKGTLRHEIAPGLRAIPAGRRGVVAFVVDDTRREVRIIAVSYTCADWITRATSRP
jgi:toxin ParE1/3/4